MHLKCLLRVVLLQNRCESKSRSHHQSKGIIWVWYQNVITLKWDFGSISKPFSILVKKINVTCQSVLLPIQLTILVLNEMQECNSSYNVGIVPRSVADFSLNHQILSIPYSTDSVLVISDVVMFFFLLLQSFLSYTSYVEAVNVAQATLYLLVKLPRC